MTSPEEHPPTTAADEQHRRVGSIFLDALDLAPDERMPFLVRACDQQEDILHEVLGLLAANSQTHDILQPPPRPRSRDSAPAETRFLPGTIVADRFRIVSLLGAGGMGEVYRATDLLLNQPVALKFLLEETSRDPKARERFFNEVRISLQITHPNVCRVYDIGETSGLVFISMEYVDGEDLRSLLRRIRRLPTDKALEVAPQLCAGLAAAHEKGILHRDLKPGNIMLDGRGKVVITDFGLAALAGQIERREMRDGTPAYMAPEQLRGWDVTEKSDLFALGVVLYEMFTGRRPFDAPTSQELALLIEEKHPQPPRSIVKDLPPEVDLIILECLSPDSERRPKSAKAVQSALQSVSDRAALDSNPAEEFPTAGHGSNPPASAAAAPATGTPTETISSGSRLSRMLWFSLASLLFLSAIAAFFWLRREPAAIDASVAVLPLEDISPKQDQQTFADGLSVELRQALYKNKSLRVEGSSSRLKDVKGNLKKLGRDLKVATLLTGSVRTAENHARIELELIKVSDAGILWLTKFDRDITDVLSIQEEVARVTAGALNILLVERKQGSASNARLEAYRACQEAQYFFQRGDRAGLEKAAGSFETATKLDPQYADAWAGLASVRSRQVGQGFIVPMSEGYKLSREAANQALAVNPNFAAAHSALGWVQMIYDWDWVAANKSYQRAKELDPDNENVIANLASLAWIMGRQDEATTLYRRAIEINPNNADAYKDFGLMLSSYGRQDEAKAYFEKALKLAPGTHYAHAFLAQVYLELSRPAEALAEAEKEPFEPYRLFAEAMAYHAAGQKKKADEALDKLIAVAKTDGPVQIAEVYAFRGEPDKAFEWLETAHRLHDGALTEVKVSPLLKRLRGDPRYPEFLKKMGLPL